MPDSYDNRVRNLPPVKRRLQSDQTADKNPLGYCEEVKRITPKNESIFTKNEELSRQVSKTASILINAGKYEDAEKLLLNAYKENPYNTHFISLLIKVYAFLNKKNEAEKLFQEVSRNSIVNAYIYNSMFLMYWQRGTEEEQQKFVELALSVGVCNSPLMINMMLWCREFNETNIAKEVLRTAFKNLDKLNEYAVIRIVSIAISINGDDAFFNFIENLFSNAYKHNLFNQAEIFNEMMKAYLRRGNYEKAQWVYDLWATFGLFNEEILCNLILAYGMSGKTDLAGSVLKFILEEYPNKPITIENANYNMLRVLVYHNKIEEAEHLYSEMCEKGQASDRIHYLMLRLYGKNGMKDRLHNTYSKIKGTVGKSDAYLDSLLILASRFESVDEAEATFNEVIKENPNDSRLYMVLATVYYTHQLYPKIDELIRAAPQEVQNNMGLMLMHAESLRKRKRYSEALKKSRYVVDAITEQYRKEGIIQRYYNENDYVHARVIEAYCLKDDKLKGDKTRAIQILRELKKKVSRNNVHYPRILCGIVFCNDVQKEEHEFFRSYLKDSLNKKVGFAKRDIEKALVLLNEQEC